MKKYITLLLGMLCIIQAFSQNVLNVGAGTKLVTTGTTSIIVSGATNVAATGSININSGTLSLNSKLAGTGTINPAPTANLLLNYAAANGSIGTLYLGSGTGTFNNLTVNITGTTPVLALGSAAIVNGTLSLGSGVIDIGANNITVGTAGTVSGGSANSFIATTGTGKMTIQNVGTAVSRDAFFPVGQTTTLYTPATISNAGTTDDFSASSAAGLPAGLTGLGNINNTWNLSEAVAGGSSATVTLGWPAALEGSSFNRSNCNVVHSNGTIIDQQGTLGIAGGTNPYFIAGTGFTSFSPFGVKSVTSQTLVFNNAPTVVSGGTVTITYGDAVLNGSATASSGLPVTYSSSNPAVATVSATGQVTNIGAGTAVITANQAGGGIYTAVSASFTLVVNKKGLTVTADNQSKVYGAANPAFTLTYSNGFVNGDNAATAFTVLPTASTTATTASPVGTYPITVSGGTTANYTLTYVAGTLTVNKAGLTATADNQTKIYGAANPALTISYSGFVNGDNAATAFTTLPTAVTTATTASPVGTYPITFNAGVSANYTVTYVAGILTVTKAALTVTADNQTKIYGAANPALTISYNGFVNGDNAASAFTVLPTATTTATVTSPVGSYPITVSGGTSANYSLSYVAGTLTVTLTITVTQAPRDTTVCAGKTATFTAAGTTNNTAASPAYQWQFSAGGSSFTNITGATAATYTVAPATAATAGWYRCTISAAGASVNTAAAHLTVNALPLLLINVADTLCLDNKKAQLLASPFGGTFSGTGVSGLLWDLRALAAGPNALTYAYTDANGCNNSTTKSVIMNVCKDATVIETVQLYPNPTTGIVHVNVLLKNDPGVWHIILYDAVGRTVASLGMNMLVGWNQAQFDLARNTNGAYYLTVVKDGDKKGTATVKFIKDK